MTPDPPVFVVGLPRSGTTLLTAMLGAHSRMDSGPETHFFTWIKRADVKRILNPRHWPAAGVAFLTSIVVDGNPVHESFGISVADMDAFLRQRAPSAQALLESLTVVRASRSGKVRWLEKTPNHLLNVDRIRDLYPTAHIVRIIRDPRDVALSLRRVPWASKSALANLYSWVDRDERSWRFFESDSGSISVRYEDLVTEAPAQLLRLCEFLGERFEDRMLKPQSSAESVISSGEWWKENVRRPISGDRVAAWRRELSTGEQRVASLVCAEPFARYGYPDPAVPRQTLRCQPLNAEFIEKNETLLIELAGRGIRLAPWNTARDLPDVAWGLPHQLRWSLGSTTSSRAVMAARLLSRMAAQRIRGRSIVWIGEDSSLEARRGVIDGTCDLILRLTACRTSRHTVIDSTASRPSASGEERAPITSSTEP